MQTISFLPINSITGSLLIGVASYSLDRGRERRGAGRRYAGRSLRRQCRDQIRGVLYRADEQVFE